MAYNKDTREEEQAQKLKPDEKDDDDIKILSEKKSGYFKIALVVLVLFCFVIFIAGVIMITTTKPSTHVEEPKTEQYSAEAKNVGLENFLEKVMKKEAEFYDEEYDPSPKRLKEKTDSAWELLKEVNEKNIDVDKLKLREKKSIEQVKHYLKYVFGRPYEANYYAGDWMLGPDNFCRTEICQILDISENILLKYKLDKEENVKQIKTKLENTGKGIEQLIENMRLGVKAGMVRSEEGCKAALAGMKAKYPKIALKSEQGVLEEESVIEYHKWLKTNNKGSLPAATSTVNDYLTKYIGRPIANLLEYMEKEHAKYCVPSSVSSGLGSLPLDYVYIEGVRDTSQPTTKKLPTGEVINGQEVYKMIMPYYTTNDMTPEEVYQLGLEKLTSLYNEILEFAKNYTGLSDSNSAVEETKTKLGSSEMYFADSLPKEESDENAHMKCTSDETAKKNCPKRWAVMKKWRKLAREVSNLIESKLTSLFYFTGDYRSVPSCPVELAFNYNPSIGIQSYSPSTVECNKASKYKIPFWLDRPGPIYFEYTVNSHESSPGHHMQFQGFTENFLESGNDSISALDQSTIYTVFIEGWGLYSEVIMDKDTDLYKQSENKLNKYGMLRAQIWRALRLVVDTGFHFYGYKREWARDLFEKYAWLTGDVVEKELTRYQNIPGQATAYMIGQLHIVKLRNFTREKLGENFDLAEFHYQVLSQGSAPLSYLENHIEKYVECKLKPDEDGCEVVLSPRKKTKSRNKQARDRKPTFLRPKHYF